MDYIDLRSDTVTTPTNNMFESMKNSPLGDDILSEDPTVKKLEEMAAEMFGKEAALFTVSGTMANQIAVMVFTNRGQEIIVGKDSHMYNLEVGALATLSQVQVRPVELQKGYLDTEVFKKEIRTSDLQSPDTGLLCLENPYDLNKGLIMDLDNLADIRDISDQYRIPVYMDGARIFNAAIATNNKVSDIVRNVDAVQVCLTKGLSAPVGSLLLGDYQFIESARRMRQRLGGGMRQAGVLAAMGIEALQSMIDRLQEDNDKAKLLASEIYRINKELIDLSEVQINIVSINLNSINIEEEHFMRELMSNGIKIKRVDQNKFRMVTHRHINEEHIWRVADVFREILNKYD